MYGDDRCQNDRRHCPSICADRISGSARRAGRSALAEETYTFEAWQSQNEERKKFAPRHQLRANQNRVLHVLRSHPEGLPVDSIPGAAEKTMAHLAKLGLVESPVDGTSEDHIWRLSLYGKDELERENIYLNWRSCSGLSHPDPI